METKDELSRAIWEAVEGEGVPLADVVGLLLEAFPTAAREAAEDFVRACVAAHTSHRGIPLDKANDLTAIFNLLRVARRFKREGRPQKQLEGNPDAFAGVLGQGVTLRQILGLLAKASPSEEQRQRKRGRPAKKR